MRMIPAFIQDDAPIGEIEVFRKLESANFNWTVIHSLDLAPYNNNRRTEIDFIIIIPDTGILCIEIKSHMEIGFDGQHWFPDTLKKSPFKQAQDARFALYRRIKERMNVLHNVPVIHCCIFPKAEFSVYPNLSIQPFEVIDKRAFKACASADAFCELIVKLANRAIQADPQLESLRKPISNAQVSEFVKFVLPIRVRRPEREIEISHREEELERILREQQRPVLRLAEYNNRVLVEGGAGTGKTLVGLEIARQKANRGNRVGYLCFNRIIGRWSENQLAADRNPKLIAGSAYSILMSLTNTSVPSDANRFFWDGLASQIQEKLTDPAVSIDSKFDYLVIDEAQDILARTELLDCVGMILEGGFESGNFIMLGDFKNQVLSFGSDIHTNLERIKSKSAIWRLTENCRNYRSIGQAALAFSAADSSTYAGYMRAGGNFDTWNLRFFNNHEDQIQQVLLDIKKCKSEGFKVGDFSMLCYGAENDSIIPQLKKPPSLEQTSAEAFSTSNVLFSSVSAYKGMENKVIFITDIQVKGSDFDRSLFYTGITRATERVYLYCHESGKEQLINWMQNSGAKQ